MSSIFDPVRILSVEKRPTLFRIKASDGQTYATANAWIASLCQQALDKGQWIELTSYAGWYYRDLTNAKLVEPQQVSA